MLTALPTPVFTVYPVAESLPFISLKISPVLDTYSDAAGQGTRQIEAVSFHFICSISALKKSYLMKKILMKVLFSVDLG